MRQAGSDWTWHAAQIARTYDPQPCGIAPAHQFRPKVFSGVGTLLSTSCLAAGADLKVVQDMLGHSSIVLTADTYAKARELHQAGGVCLV